MARTTVITAAAFVLALGVHLYVLARALQYRTDRDPTLSSWAQFTRFLGQSPASGWDTAQYAPEGRQWVPWVIVTMLIAGAALIGLLASI